MRASTTVFYISAGARNPWNIKMETSLRKSQQTLVAFTKGIQGIFLFGLGRRFIGPFCCTRPLLAEFGLALNSCFGTGRSLPPFAALRQKRPPRLSGGRRLFLRFRTALPSF